MDSKMIQNKSNLGNQDCLLFVICIKSRFRLGEISRMFNKVDIFEQTIFEQTIFDYLSKLEIEIAELNSSS